MIPCHNEEVAIAPVMGKIAEVRSRVPGLREVIVVNDGSTDRSPEILKQYSHIEVLNSEKCLGYGGALKMGFRHASSDLIVFLDMDDTYDIRQLPEMLQQFENQNLDVLFGNRLNDKNGMPWVRRLGNNLYYYCLRVMGFPHIGDPCTGMRLFKSELKDEFCSVSQNDLSYSMALTLRIINGRMKFSEMPIYYYERAGESKLNPLSDGVKFFWAILRHRLLA
ncbi:Undecaprenyl-phosphate mannosyltransferase [compost metagenome]